jgi:hypothetical protein
MRVTTRVDTPPGSSTARATLPINPKAFPGLPGGRAFDWNSVPIEPSGPSPTGGILAQDKIIPAGVKHYLATLDAPRKQSPDRIPPDEFALMVASYNRTYGTALSIDPMSPLWKTSPAWWNTREAIAKVAVSRWNSYMCKAGRGHCANPGLLGWIGRAIKSVGKVLSKVMPIARLIPILGQGIAAVELGVNAVNGLKQVASVGEQVIAKNKVLTAGRSLLPATDADGFNIGAALMHAPGLTKEQLVKVRQNLKGANLRGFDSAVSMQSGMATSHPPKGALDDPHARAAFYATMGMQGASPQMKLGMLTEIAKNPRARPGVVLAAQAVKDKGWIAKVIEALGFYSTEPVSASAPAKRATNKAA